MKPLISVIMPVYNSGKYVKSAIDSVLKQTLSDFELLVIDDGSTDDTLEIVKQITDTRIRIIQNSENKGLIYTLNLGLKLATGEYIARMDGDDICVPERFEKQYKYLKKHPEIGLTGCYTALFGNKNGFFAVRSNQDMKTRLFFGSVFAHPGFMMRKEFLDQHNIRYRAEFIHAEDYDFLTQCAEVFPIGNVEQVLLLYRVHESQISSKQRDTQTSTTDVIRCNMLRKRNALPDEKVLPYVLNFLKYKKFNDNNEVNIIYNYIKQTDGFSDEEKKYLKDCLIMEVVKSKLQNKGKILIKFGMIYVIMLIITRGIEKIEIKCRLQYQMICLNKWRKTIHDYH